MSMTLDEAILHAEEVASEKFENVDFIRHNPFGDKSKIQGCLECAAEHRQLAAWLRELQERRKASDIIFCKDCKAIYCDFCLRTMKPVKKEKDYCSWAERRTDK